MELLLEQMMGAFPENDQSRLPRTMQEEAREGSELLTGEVINPEGEHPVCPDCGERHPQGPIVLLVRFY